MWTKHKVEEVVSVNGPRCPDCEELMVKSHVQWQDNSWTTFWTCSCETPDNIKASVVFLERSRDADKVQCIVSTSQDE